mgnify:CR=1 FL=1
MRSKKPHRIDEYPLHLRPQEVRLLGSLVTHHIKNLELLSDCTGRGGAKRLPEHKNWFYELEEIIDDYVDLLS